MTARESAGYAQPADPGRASRRPRRPRPEITPSAGRDAAEELFNGCYPRLTGWVRRLVDTDEDAHDIAAEAFARLLGRWSRVDNPHGYLYMIAANLISDHWRKAGREQRAIKHLATAAEAASCHQAQDADVRALIEALPPRLRTAFLLHHYAGFEVRQIAAMTGRPEGTIKADLYHARIRLKAALTDTGDPRAGAVTGSGGGRIARPVGVPKRATTPGRPGSAARLS